MVTSPDPPPVLKGGLKTRLVCGLVRLFTSSKSSIMIRVESSLSSTSVYYSEHKPKNKNGGGLGTRLSGECFISLHSGPAVRFPESLTFCSPLLWLLQLLLLLLGWRLFHVPVWGGGDDQVVCGGECHLPPSPLTSPLPHFKQVVHGVRETLATVLVG